MKEERTCLPAGRQASDTTGDAMKYKCRQQNNKKPCRLTGSFNNLNKYFYLVAGGC